VGASPLFVSPPVSPRRVDATGELPKAIWRRQAVSGPDKANFVLKVQLLRFEAAEGSAKIPRARKKALRMTGNRKRE
jgi:hypothetical protein